MRLMTAFLSYTLILVTACGKDAKDRLPNPLLYSPNGSLPGGVGTPHTIKLVPAGSAEVKRDEAIGYPVLAGRQPVKLVVDSAWQIDVKEVKCEHDRLCSDVHGSRPGPRHQVPIGRRVGLLLVKGGAQH